MDSNDNTKPPIEPTSIPAPSSSKQKFVSRRERTLQAKAWVATSGTRPILDAALDEHDIRMSMIVEVHGREVKFAQFTVERTVLDALNSPKDRWRVLQALENILQEIHQSVGAKMNSKLNATKPELPKDKGDELGHEGIV